MHHNDGYTFIEMIVALAICAFLTPLVSALLKTMLHIPKHVHTANDKVMIHQLRLLLAEGSEADVDDQSLVLLYRDQDCHLRLDKKRLVKRPGYEIYADDLRLAQFYEKDKCIYIKWKHTDEKTTKQALLGC